MKFRSDVPAVPSLPVPVTKFRSYQIVWPSNENELGVSLHPTLNAIGMVCDASSALLYFKPPIESVGSPATLPISTCDLSWSVLNPSKDTFAYPFPAVSSGNELPKTASLSVGLPVKDWPAAVGYNGPFELLELFHLSLLFAIFMFCKKFPLAVIVTV